MILMILQLLMLNGKLGANGPNAQHLVALGPKSGPEHAVSQILEGNNTVQEIPQKLRIAQHLSAQAVQVIPKCNLSMHFHCSILPSICNHFFNLSFLSF